MRAKAWAHRRVSLPLDASATVPLAEVAGDGRARLRIRSDRAATAAPISGSLTYPASWQAGRWSGDAAVGVFLQWTWGYELHVALSPPDSLAGRLVWGRRRLDGLANGLAEALRESAEAQRSVDRRISAATARAARRWSPTSASGSAR